MLALSRDQRYTHQDARRRSSAEGHPGNPGETEVFVSRQEHISCVRPSTLRCKSILVVLAVSLPVITFGGRTIAEPREGLFTPGRTFRLDSHIVSTSVFHWYTRTGHQLRSPWVALGGRDTWTGEPEFWKGQIKQIMSANIDMMYVHLIPDSAYGENRGYERQRINLFQALNELRADGYDVPQVAPFLDPMITWNWNGPPSVDVATAAGKQEFVDQYIRFYNQYYSVNQDPHADGYVARIDNRVVLNTWYVKYNLIHSDHLTRQDVESRLAGAFGRDHPIFNDGIYMVVSDYRLDFRDEKVAQFQCLQYLPPQENLWANDGWGRFPSV